MFSGIQSKIILAGGVVIALLGVIGYFYWSWSQDEIQTLTKNNAILTTSVKIQKDTIADLQNYAAIQKREIELLQDQTNNAETRRRDLENKLRQLNIEASARNNRSELENKINAQSLQIFSDIESITNSSQTEVPKK